MMTAATAAQPRPREEERADQRMVLYGVSWGAYEAMVEALAEQHVFLTYDNGRLEIMSPSPRHEMLGLLIARMVHSYTQVLRIPIFSLGMTTWKRRDLEKGLEADQCFYVQNEARMRHAHQIDLAVDPPPDLAVEVDLSNSSTRKQAIYAALAVPELWRYDARGMYPMVLRNGAYVESEQSLAFPGLPVRELSRFIGMRDTMGETELFCVFQEWVETKLRP